MLLLPRLTHTQTYSYSDLLRLRPTHTQYSDLLVISRIRTQTYSYSDLLMLRHTHTQTSDLVILIRGAPLRGADDDEVSQTSGRGTQERARAVNLF